MITRTAKRIYLAGMICRPWITVHGERIFARSYGKKAFCFYPSNRGNKKTLAVATDRVL